MPNKDTAYQITQDLVARLTGKNPYKALYGSMSEPLDVEKIHKPQNRQEYIQLIDVATHYVDKLGQQIDNFKKD